MRNTSKGYRIIVTLKVGAQVEFNAKEFSVSWNEEGKAVEFSYSPATKLLNELIYLDPDEIAAVVSFPL